MVAPFQEEAKGLHGVVTLEMAWRGPRGQTADLAAKCIQIAKRMEGRISCVELQERHTKHKLVHLVDVCTWRRMESSCFISELHVHEL